MLLLLVATVQQPAAAQACDSAVFTACPSALAAAQVLTGNSSLLPISNAAFTTPSGCNTTNSKVGLLIITSFGSNPCHYLGQNMSTGAGDKQRSTVVHKMLAAHSHHDSC